MTNVCPEHQDEAMEIEPVYDRTILTIEDGPAVAVAMVRQRRRLLEVLASLTDEQWSAPSRCENWRVQDVAAHLAGVDPFWALSITAGLAGQPTRFLQGFDPKATPAAMVEAAAAKSAAETLAELHAATAALCELVEGLDDEALDKPAEAPPGHIAIRDLLHHALWDAWVHERDIVVPLGLAPTEEPDEIAASLRYVAALSPAFAVGTNTAGEATLVLDPTDRDDRVVVTVTPGSVRVHGNEAPDDAVVLRGRAVDLIEMLSARAPLTADVPADRAWLVRRLADVFEV